LRPSRTVCSRRSIQILVLEVVEHRVHVRIELLDGVGLDAVDARPLGFEVVEQFLAAGAQVVLFGDIRFDAVDLVFDVR
jgi:hypothetical protein